MLAISHDPAFVARSFPRVWRLREGRVEAASARSEDRRTILEKIIRTSLSMVYIKRERAIMKDKTLALVTLCIAVNIALGRFSSGGIISDG